MARLSRDVTIVYAGAEITIPKGTRLLIVPGGGGEVHFAVESQALLTRLTGNTHDPKYRYAFMPADAVEH